MQRQNISYYSEHLKIFLYLSLFIGMLLSIRSANAATDHTDLLTSYEGSKTCLPCHSDAVDEITGSIHYKMLGQVQDVYDMFTNQPVTGMHGKGNRY